MDAVQTIVVTGAAALVALLVFLVREQRLTRFWLTVLTAVSGLGLVVMVLSDWPFETLAQFWADHSVLASLLSTILLLALGFLAFEEAEQRRQQQLDTSLTAAGLSGVVDHVVDVEVALALLSEPVPPDARGWTSWDDQQGKPLRWLRLHRDRLNREGRALGDLDPRALPPTLPEDATGTAWRDALVDQAVRRLSAALRDWSPVIGVSRNGRVMLVAIATVRKDLMRLPEHLDKGEMSEAEMLLVELRRRCRLMAFFFETVSDSYPPRPEVLRTFQPLPPITARASELGIRDEGMSREWKHDLVSAEQQLEAP